MSHAKYWIGEVVCAETRVTHDGEQVTYRNYGTVIGVPWAGYPFYRVRVSTKSFTEYVELGVPESELRREGE